MAILPTKLLGKPELVVLYTTHCGFWAVVKETEIYNKPNDINSFNFMLYFPGIALLFFPFLFYRLEDLITSFSFAPAKNFIPDY
jgi:hypothetical protein